MGKIKVIAVVGPTASGKTALSIELAKRLNGEIVSADSMQVYKNMPVASAAPTKEEMQNVPHHLISFLEPTERFSVADYVNLAKEKIEDVANRGKTPILVGGTGLYVDSLLGGMKFLNEDTAEIRQKLEDEAEACGIEVLFERLKSIDPEYAEKLHINDRKRIIRALEMISFHNKTVTILNKEAMSEDSPFDVTYIGLMFEDREKLYDRINLRVDIMLKNGLLEEAKTAYLNKGSKTSVQAIGHKEFFGYFDGQNTLEEAVEKLKMETRRYAKRQMTWFRKNNKINWIAADKETDILVAAENVLKGWE